MTTNIIDKIRELGHPKFIPGESEGSQQARMRDAETFEKASDAAEALGDLLNGGDRMAVLAGFVNGMLKQHRYLQNNAIITVLTALGEIGALPEGQYVDGRNEFAHKLCKLLRERFKDELFWR